ncbi:MFS transporter [Paenibacillus amylolyticus]|uniref:Major facilitator family transporter n=1 Tax=Paenibacillus amylolyticus TaxID=1451 RepID=A0A124DXL1_PAEAM|nr:MFS transporter [Paenibacillus amylolyticus]GAS81393.1 major facilitator family transporter [Paenibacillus amylolyticus]
MQTSSLDAQLSNQDRPAISRLVAILFAVCSGLAVASIYYAQPLLDSIAQEFNLSPSSIGIVITVTQICYALGLFLLVPLGDLLNRRKLIIIQMLLSVLALVLVGTSQSSSLLFTGMAVVGLLAVITQTLVAFAAHLAAPSERGRIVGQVTSGIVIGILLARTVAGTLNDWLGWRSVYLFSASITLLGIVALCLVLPRQQSPQVKQSYFQLLRSVLLLYREMPVLRVRGILAMLIFTAFSILWTSMVLPLSSPPLSLSHTVIGAFGLAGAAGALVAARAGKLADRGLGQKTTGISLVILLLSWLPIGYVHHSLWFLILGVILLDLAVQAVHVTNQSLIYEVRPEAQSRLTAAYMIFYSIGSAAGSIVSTQVYAWAGWTAVCWLGAGVSAAALLFWMIDRYINRNANR